jgi:hypothetical protein
MKPTLYALIMKMTVVTIWLNLRVLPAQAQVPLVLSTSNNTCQKSLSQSINTTPPPPDNGAPDDRSDAASRAV